MIGIFRFPTAARRDQAVADWLAGHDGGLGDVARYWFDVVRGCGDDVRELLHDGHPTACVTDAAFAYVNVFTRHVNVGFFRGAGLPDPTGLLTGTGKSMRHVKIMPDGIVDVPAMMDLIDAAYADMKQRLELGPGS
jgi:hypothetical protein